jgi:hypothetical protein
MRTANDVLEATAEVERTRPTVGRKIMTSFATALGGTALAGAPGALTGVLLGPIVDAALGAGVTTKLQTARLMRELATAARRGNAQAAASIGARLRRLPQMGSLVDQLKAAPEAAMAQERGAE